ncbi:MAG: hypothetical protein PHH37_04150 [Paludibacter sp.]|nr:hypothetical protein [Paludibacter sp.]
MKQIIICIGVFMISFFELFAQVEKKQSEISVVYGTKTLNSEMNDAWPIRQDVSSSFYSNGYNLSVDVENRLDFVGVKYEYYFYENKLSVLSGLKVLFFNSGLIKADQDDGGYYYLRIKTEGTTTEYARVKSITESSTYAGIPVELKYTPFDYKYFSFYGKLCLDVAYKLATNTNINFKQAEMQEYESTVLNEINPEANSFYGTIYAAVGANLRLNKSLYINLDVFVPSFLTTTDNSGLVNVQNDSGVQISLSIPFK